MSDYSLQEFNPVDGVFFLIYRNGEMIAKTWNRQEADCIISALSNSKRVQACVNACTGMPDSLLNTPGYNIKQELDSLDKQIFGRLKAERERDELLAAAWLALEQFDQMADLFLSDEDFLAARATLSEVANKAAGSTNGQVQS